MTNDIKPSKFKILMLADNPLSTSGVGCQANHLITGLVKKGRWTFRVLGGALKHPSYDPIMVSPDYIVKPVDGFGDQNLIRELLVKERPDAIFLFTDPRFFIWLWSMEDEIHQICPIVYWHVWDNDPYPSFNDPLYKSTDLINCHSYLTYELVSEHFPEKTNFIPHSLPPHIFKPIQESSKLEHKARILGDTRLDHFTLIWVNRNARRKMPGNLLLSWSKFLERLEREHGHRKATLLLHTNPYDSEGQNLPVIAEHLGISENVIYSTARISFDDMNILYGISDACINISSFEGFGLSTLESMQCGRPIIALKTGGLTRQVVDHRDGSTNGIAIDPTVRDLVGGQQVPYIFEDHVSTDTVADAIYEMYAMGDEARRTLGEKARRYVLSEFAYQDTVDKWDETMYKTIMDWRKAKRADEIKRWEVLTL